MKKKSVLSLILAGSLALGVGIGTYAWFTSTAASNTNKVTTGTLEVDLKKNITDAVLAQVTNFQPGDVVTKDDKGNPGYTTVEIVNNGSLPLGYFDNFIINGEISMADKIIIKNFTNSLYRSGQQNPVFTDHFIAEYISQYSASNADKNKDGKVTLAEWLDASHTDMGPANGWDFGALNPGDKFVQSFELAFDEDAGNSFQGKTLNIGYKVAATQVNAKAVNKALNDNNIVYGADGSNLIDYMNYRLNLK